MVSFTSLALLSLAAVGSLAAPQKRWSNDQCMTGAEAQQVADNYAELIRNYSDELAKEALAKDFTDYSEGVNTLINTCPQGAAAQTLPLLSASFSNRKEFMVGQGQQPAINFKQLNIEYNCNYVIIRWETTNTAPIPNPRPVVGLIMIEAEKAPAGHKYPWIVHTVYSEFDSGAWLQNLEQWGICTVHESGSPTIQLPSGTVGPAPTSTTASSYVTPASASGYATSAPASSSVASSAATPSSYATASSYAASSAAASSYAASSAAASGYVVSSAAASASAYTA